MKFRQTNLTVIALFSHKCAPFFFWCFGTADVSHLIINAQNATSKSPVIISFPFVDSSSSYGMFDFIFFQNAK